MLKNIFFILFFCCSKVTAQTIDSIYVNLYTDSLKKGTYNYINIDGKLKNGRFIPLDSTYITFKTDVGFFIGNNLVVDKNEKAEKANLIFTLRKNPQVVQSAVIYFKTLPDPASLKTADQIFTEMQQAPKKTKKKKRGWF
jgi:hypothetical protein